MSRCSRYAPVALSVCVSVWIGWSLFGIRHPVALRIINIPDTAPGATAVVKVTGEEQQYCDGVAHRWLLDRNGGYYPLPDTAVFHPARNKVVTFYHEFTVPRSFPPGPSEYDSEVVRYCNVWQWAFWPLRERYSAKFTVTQ